MPKRIIILPPQLFLQDKGIRGAQSASARPAPMPACFVHLKHNKEPAAKAALCSRALHKSASSQRSSTSVRRHAVQQLHHAFPLHCCPLLDGGAPSNPAVLLLDLGRAALGDEGSQLTAAFKGTQSTISTESPPLSPHLKPTRSKQRCRVWFIPPKLPWWQETRVCPGRERSLAIERCVLHC